MIFCVSTTLVNTEGTMRKYVHGAKDQDAERKTTAGSEASGNGICEGTTEPMTGVLPEVGLGGRGQKGFPP